MTALLEYIDLLNRYSRGPDGASWGPLSGWGLGKNAPVAPPPPHIPPLLWAALCRIKKEQEKVENFGYQDLPFQVIVSVPCTP